MAYDYFISTKEGSDRLAIPEWISERNNKMKSKISHGETDYEGTFTKEELLKSAAHYAEVWDGIMNDMYLRLHKKGLEYIGNADTDEFIISAIYWTSDAY